MVDKSKKMPFLEAEALANELLGCFKKCQEIAKKLQADGDCVRIHQRSTSTTINFNSGEVLDIIRTVNLGGPIDG